MYTNIQPAQGLFLVNLETREGAGRRFTQRRIAFLVGLGVALVALAAIVRWRSLPFDWARFFKTLTNVDATWLGCSIGLMLLTYVIRVMRWEIMLRPLVATPDWMGLCSATVIGFTAVVLLGRAGELVRPYLIAKKEKVTFSSQMAAWLLERILDAIAVVVIFGVALTILPARQLHLGPGLTWVLRAGGYIMASVCALCILCIVAFRNFSGIVQERVVGVAALLPARAARRVGDILAAFTQGMQSIRDRETLLLLLLYTCFEWLVIVAAFYTLFRALGATGGFSLADCLVFVGFVCLGSIVQIPGIGGGVQVASVLVFTEIFGIRLEVASGLAILIWLISFVAIVPFGLAFALHEGINLRKLKHLPEDVPS